MIHSRAIRSFEFRDRMLCSIAAAVLGAGALGAGASIWGANKAADAQTNAANAAISQQQQMYNANSNNLSPYINAGSGGLTNLTNWLNPNSPTLGAGGAASPLSSLLSLVTPGANQDATLSQLPGYQFSTDQGTRAALNALAARGLGGSPGAIAKGVGSFVSGNAQTYYNQDVNNLINTFTAGAGGMQNLVNSGVTAGSSLAGVGTNTANAISGSITGAGNANAAAANATGAAVSGLGNTATTAALLQQLTGGSNNGGVYGASALSNGPTNSQISNMSDAEASQYEGLFG